MPNALRSRAWLLLAASITLQLVILRSVKVLRHDHLLEQGGAATTVVKRGDPSNAVLTNLFELPYDQWYLHASPAAKPFVLLALTIILCFLFSFIGISASDFFCPNLATIASVLGLNESTAGVTFLAFGNGSPDVFSTFAALDGGTFGLAIGELIGAATFSHSRMALIDSVVSVVVGSIALIRPFHVPRSAFLRDTLFFIAAVLVLISVLRDGRLNILESGGMVLLYAAYVGVVVLGNWWQRRRRRQAAEKEREWKETRSFDEIGREPSPLSSPMTERPPSPLQASPTPSLVPSPELRPIPLGRPSHRRLPSLAIHNIATHDETDELATHRANFSLLGAIEFRDVVNTLKSQSSRPNSPGRSPYTATEREDYFGAIMGHRRSISSPQEWPQYSMAAALGSTVNVAAGVTPTAIVPTDASGRRRSASLHPRAKTAAGLRMTQSTELPVPERSTSMPTKTITPIEPNPWTDQTGRPASPSSLLAPPTLATRAPNFHLTIPDPNIRLVPSISVTDPQGHLGAPVTPRSATTPRAPGESMFRIRRRTRAILWTLFPSLRSFRHKSYIGMIMAILSVPAILALTLTLPVVDDGRGDEGGIALPLGEDEPLQDEDLEEDGEEIDGEVDLEVGEELHHLVETGFSPLHSPLGRIRHSISRHGGVMEDCDETEEEMQEEEEGGDGFSKELTVAQTFFGPVVCAALIFNDLEIFPWIMLGVSLASLASCIAVYFYAVDGSSPFWRIVRCFCGFTCSMVWIASIANEVVGVLLAVGEALGLSEAIIGLTIFAVGNSLADLVANITVAQFAPTMAYAACFGGPMLNLLLGVGGAGSYGILVSHRTVSIHFSPTLWVSAGGLVLMLVATAIFVPMNGYLIDRRWAGFLIAGYVVLMVVNVVVEIQTGRS